MSKHRTPRKMNTVVIDGTVIASFVLRDDAEFFARKANEAGLFELTNPGSECVAYDHRGNRIEPDSYRPR